MKQSLEKCLYNKVKPSKFIKGDRRRKTIVNKTYHPILINWCQSKE